MSEAQPVADEAIAKALCTATRAFPSYRIEVDRIVPGSLQIRLYNNGARWACLRWQLWDYEVYTPLLMEAAIDRMREELDHATWLSQAPFNASSPSGDER